MDEFKRGQVYFQPLEKPAPDFRMMALLAAQTVKSNSVQELLSNAEKIEYWLREPERTSAEFRKSIQEAFSDIRQKSPAK